MGYAHMQLKLYRPRARRLAGFAKAGGKAAMTRRKRRQGSNPIRMKSTYLFLVLCLTATSAILAAPTQAAELTAADEEQLRQIERERVLREQLQRVPDVRLERPEADPARRIPVDETPCYPIRRIVLKGDFAERFH